LINTCNETLEEIKTTLIQSTVYAV